MGKPLSDRASRGLARAAEALLPAFDLASLIVGVLESAREAIPGAEKGSVLFWDEVFQTLHVSHVVGYEDERAVKTTFPVTRGYAARCARERRALVIADAREDAEIRYDGEIEELRSIRSAALAPLLARDRLLGVISLDSTRRAAFDEDDLVALTLFARLTALALDNSRLHRDLERSSRGVCPECSRRLDPDQETKLPL